MIRSIKISAGGALAIGLVDGDCPGPNKPMYCIVEGELTSKTIFELLQRAGKHLSPVDGIRPGGYHAGPI
jgi:hypothetical protein